MAQPPDPMRNRWWLIAAAGIAVFMAQSDVTAVTVAMPTIEADFGTATGLTQWVMLSYVLPMVALSLPAGRWLDTFGRREALVGSLAGFALASVAVGLSPGIAWLIAARAVQGAFGAVLFAQLPVLATTSVRPEARGRAMAVVMTLGPLGAVSGPALGGVIIEHLGWPWVFYLNVPVSLVVIVIAYAQLPAGVRPRLPGRAWFAEAGLLSGAALALMVALSLTAAHGAGWMALALLALPFLAVWRRTPASATARELMRLSGMRGPHLALLVQMAAVMAVQFLIPFFLQDHSSVSPTVVGLTMLAFPAGVVAGGLAGGSLADRWGARPIAVGGTVLVVTGIALLVPLSSDWSPNDLAWRLAVAGLGSGLFAGQNQLLAMAAAPTRLLATTGATTSLVRQLGLALGPALATATWGLAGGGLGGMTAALALATALGALSVLALAGRHRRPTAKPQAPPASARDTSHQ